VGPGRRTDGRSDRTVGCDYRDHVMTRVLSYEPKDLTISVEAGLPWAELSRVLAEKPQMVPLDPPFAGLASVAASCRQLQRAGRRCMGRLATW